MRSHMSSEFNSTDSRGTTSHLPAQFVKTGPTAPKITSGNQATEPAMEKKKKQRAHFQGFLFFLLVKWVRIYNIVAIASDKLFQLGKCRE